VAEQWPGKAKAKAGNFYTLPDGKVRFYAGGDEFRVGGVDNQGITRLDTGALLSQFVQGLMPKEGRRRNYGSGLAMHDFGGLPDRKEPEAEKPAPEPPRTAPAQNIEPIVDRDVARNEVYTQMMQQYGGDTKEEAYANAPRPNEVGYSQRADIQAWMKANPALAESFMAKQRAKGLVDETSTEFGGVRLKQPKGNSLEDIDTRKQGAMVNPATGQTNIQDAQDSVNRVRAQEMVDVMRGESQVEGLEFGNVPGQPRLINQASMISKGEQAIGEQAKKTEAAIPLWDKSMQPYSAGSDIGIEPSQVWNMANIGELPVFGGGKLLFGRYAGK
tara:strand:- start:3483 stop:4472 length:990 start_codon:yes stop_codon:yes gene_type:complete